jgi:FkbM family methyltransferase
MELDLRDENQRDFYAEVYETHEVAFIRKLLRPGQTVIDVGANIGYITCVALDRVGRSGQVHAFEPVPEYFQRLARQAQLNPGFRVYPVNCAAGKEEGVLSISLSNDGNIGWNTLVPGFMPPEQIRQQVPVRVRPLDDYIQESGLEMVHFIKIDAEGFEFYVLQGLRNCLQNYRPIILCEIAPGAYPLLGCTLTDVRKFLDEMKCQVTDLELRPLDLEALERSMNVVLLPIERGGTHDSKMPG